MFFVMNYSPHVLYFQSQSSSNAPDLISGFDEFKSANDFDPRATNTTTGMMTISILMMAM